MQSSDSTSSGSHSCCRRSIVKLNAQGFAQVLNSESQPSAAAGATVTRDSGRPTAGGTSAGCCRWSLSIEGSSGRWLPPPTPLPITCVSRFIAECTCSHSSRFAAMSCSAMAATPCSTDDWAESGPPAWRASAKRSSCCSCCSLSPCLAPATSPSALALVEKAASSAESPSLLLAAGPSLKLRGVLTRVRALQPACAACWGCLSRSWPEAAAYGISRRFGGYDGWGTTALLSPAGSNGLPSYQAYLRWIPAVG